MENWLNRKEQILQTPLPVNSKKYGVIPHSVVLTELEEKLDKNNYKINNVKYLTANNNQIITAVYRLESDVDIDIKPSITLVNSYNKTRKAGVIAGMEVLVCRNGLISNSGINYSRKHIGDFALKDFQENIDKAILNLGPELNILRTNVKQMKNIEIDDRIKAQLIGDMLINESMINSVQLGIIQKELKFSEHFKTNSLWDFYNNITEGFKHNHPLHYDKQHIKFHTYITDIFQLEGARNLYKKQFFIPKEHIN